MLRAEFANCNEGWAGHAHSLADWTLSRLINRLDCWGGYRPASDVGREFTRTDGTKGRLGSQTTRKGRLTRRLVARHYAATDRTHIVGLHSTSPSNTSMWGALDIDVHDGSTVSPDVTVAAALAWYEILRSRGFRPLLTTSNGKGGYHLRILFKTPAPTADLFQWLRRLVADHAQHGLTAPPETFPKQPRIEPGQFGNWLRLPGKHHTHNHWSEVWNGNCWLAGEDAVAHLLSLNGDPAELIPPAPPAPPPATPLPYRPVVAPEADVLTRRIQAYLAKLPRLSAGQGRDAIAYNFAAFLQRDLALSLDQALPWLMAWDVGNNPPKGEEALREIAANAFKYGRQPIGSGLTSPQRPAHPRRRHGIIRATVEI